MLIKGSSLHLISLITSTPGRAVPRVDPVHKLVRGAALLPNDPRCFDFTPQADPAGPTGVVVRPDQDLQLIFAGQYTKPTDQYEKNSRQGLSGGWPKFPKII